MFVNTSPADSRLVTSRSLRLNWQSHSFDLAVSTSQYVQTSKVLDSNLL